MGVGVHPGDHAALRVQVQRPETGPGLSGFVLIAERHISLHSFQDKNYVPADIFLCRAFDTDFAGDYLRRTFGMTKVDCNILDRGTEFPKHISAAAEVRTQRRRVGRPAALTA